MDVELCQMVFVSSVEMMKGGGIHNGLVDHCLAFKVPLSLAKCIILANFLILLNSSLFMKWRE